MVFKQKSYLFFWQNRTEVLQAYLSLSCLCGCVRICYAYIYIIIIQTYIVLFSYFKYDHLQPIQQQTTKNTGTSNILCHKLESNNHLHYKITVIQTEKNLNKIFDLFLYIFHDVKNYLTTRNSPQLGYKVSYVSSLYKKGLNV